MRLLSEEFDGSHFFDLSSTKPPEYELHNVVRDDAYINNLWSHKEHKMIGETIKMNFSKNYIKLEPQE